MLAVSFVITKETCVQNSAESYVLAHLLSRVKNTRLLERVFMQAFGASGLMRY